MNTTNSNNDKFDFKNYLDTSKEDEDNLDVHITSKDAKKYNVPKSLKTGETYDNDYYISDYAGKTTYSSDADHYYPHYGRTKSISKNINDYKHNIDDIDFNKKYRDTAQEKLSNWKEKNDKSKDSYSKNRVKHWQKELDRYNTNIEDSENDNKNILDKVKQKHQKTEESANLKEDYDERLGGNLEDFMSDCQDIKNALSSVYSHLATHRAEEILDDIYTLINSKIKEYIGTDLDED